MSKEQLKAFIEKAKADTSLQDKLKGAASPEAAIEIAKEAGFVITAEDIQSMQSTTVELSDEELEGASGGAGNNCGFTAPRRDGRPATRMVRGPSCGRSH